jgi:peptidyl-prolyl cis-trans isomerase B (cyclophilin B)
MLKRPIALASLALAAAVTLSACGSDSEGEAKAQDKGPCSYPSSGTAAKSVKAPSDTPSVTGIVDATLKLSAGDIHLKLNADEAPCTVNSFLSLAEQGYFDDTTCHRLTTSGIFVLQCGDPSATGAGGPGYRYDDELSGAEALEGSGVKNYAAGTLAMANSGANTNGSQFFLVYEDSPLEPNYTVFGTFDASGVADLKKVASAGLAADGVAPKETVTISGVTTS